MVPITKGRVTKLHCVGCGFVIPDELPNRREFHYWYDPNQLDFYHKNNKRMKP